jgi:transmembrane sensor
MAADQTPQGDIDRAAAAWLTRLGSPLLDDADRHAYRAWIDADPARRAAFEQARRLWGELAAPAAALAAAERQRVRRRRLLAAAVAASLLAVAGLATRGGAEHATAYGEVQTVTLPDGSRMTLDGNSAADVRVDADARRVTLRRGRAFFDVTEDTARPFVVVAGPVETTVLGTAFAVDRDGADVAVVVERGRVDVRDASGAAAALVAGEGVEAPAGRVGMPEPAALGPVLAWRRGLMVFDDRSLGEVAADLARSTGTRIVIPQASVQGLRLSGVFSEDDPAAVLAAIEAGLGVRVARLGVATVIFR